MLARLFLLFTIVPLVELYLLIKIGSYLGALNTVLLIVITGILGALLARLEGLRTLRQITRNLSRGIVPAEELIDGVIIFVAGILLVTPGVLTDVMGLFFLFPHTRTIFKRWLRRKLDRMAASGNFRIYFGSGSRDDF
ncbi:MAG: FxsA family protein [Candidatus Binatia bacterium]